MSVFTQPSSSTQACSLSKTSSKSTKASCRNPSNSYFPGFFDAIFGCFSSKSSALPTQNHVSQPILYRSKSRQQSNRPTTSLLPAQEERYKGRKTLVLDLDETLVHTSNAATGQCFRNMCIRINNQRIFVTFRPGVKEFLKRMGAIYEIVIFTASLQDYAEQVIKSLDDDGVVAHKLYRGACTQHGDSLVKDLGRLSRPLKDIIIVDNSTICYDFHPNNGLKIEDFIDNPRDDALVKLTPLLERLAVVDDVRPIQFWQDEHNRAKATSHKSLRITTESTYTKMSTMTSTEGHLTPATIPKKTGRNPLNCPSDKVEMTQSPMLILKEKMEVH